MQYRSAFHLPVYLNHSFWSTDKPNLVSHKLPVLPPSPGLKTRCLNLHSFSHQQSKTFVPNQSSHYFEWSSTHEKLIQESVSLALQVSVIHHFAPLFKAGSLNEQLAVEPACSSLIALRVWVLLPDCCPGKNDVVVFPVSLLVL
jgi:hypothetical protein